MITKMLNCHFVIVPEIEISNGDIIFKNIPDLDISEGIKEQVMYGILCMAELFFKHGYYIRFNIDCLSKSNEKIGIANVSITNSFQSTIDDIKKSYSRLNLGSRNKFEELNNINENSFHEEMQGFHSMFENQGLFPEYREMVNCNPEEHRTEFLKYFFANKDDNMENIENTFLASYYYFTGHFGEQSIDVAISLLKEKIGYELFKRLFQIKDPYFLGVLYQQYNEDKNAIYYFRQSDTPESMVRISIINKIDDSFTDKSPFCQYLIARDNLSISQKNQREIAKSSYLGGYYRAAELVFIFSESKEEIIESISYLSEAFYKHNIIDIYPSLIRAYSRFEI